MAKIIEVRLGEYRPVYKFDMNDVPCTRGDTVILEVSKGMEVGLVISEIPREAEDKKEQIMGKVVRRATEGDWNQIGNNRQKAIDAINTCIRKINDRRLEMKIVQAEFTFDSSKIIFFFTADGRVDFRALVKDLAKIFRVRIELKQIGVRDRSKIVSGYGVCGRELCCSSFIKNFHPLSIKMTKEQALPLNPTRISGVCGRIKCCMAYEFFAYRDLSKNLPKIGDRITTPQGKGRVKDVNILRRWAVVDLGEGKTTKVVFDQDDG